MRKKANTSLNPNTITSTLSKQQHQPLIWSAEEFITLKNKINNEDENNKRKIINQHVISCLKPFTNQLILNKKKIKEEQKKRNDKIINILTKKITFLKQQATNKIKQFPTIKTIKKLENQINELTNMLINITTNIESDNKNIKFSKQLLAIINEEQQLKKKKNIKNKYKSHYKL